MKLKTHLIWAFIGLSVGCSQPNELQQPNPSQAQQPQEPASHSSLIRDCLSRQLKNGELSYRVSEREALILTDILDEDINDYEIEYFTYETDTLLYILNSSNGWKLLSSDKRTQPVLAYSESGTFSVDSLNPGEAIWLDEMAEELYEMAHDEETAESEDEFVEEADPTWVNLAPAMASSDTYNDGEWILEKTETWKTEKSVKGLTSTTWSQDDPWNQCCPWGSSTKRTLAGCVAIAGAQMLYYLHDLWGVPATMYTAGYCNGTPSNFQFEFSAASAEAWDLMAKTGNYGSYYSSILIGLIGSSIHMKYGLDKSSAKTEDLKGFFNDYGINSNYTEYNSQTVFQSLDKRIPVIVDAYRSRTNRFLGWIYTYHNGHAWIIDGYKKEYKVTKTVYRWYTYYTTPDSGEEDWEAGKPGDKGDGWENAVDEDAEEEADDGENGDSGNPARSGRMMRSSSQPIYPTDRTNIETISMLTGKYVHMNWGWGPGYNTNWYAADGEWKTGNRNYKWKRKMLVATGHK